MVVILKAMMACVEDNIGSISDVKLNRKEPDKTYTCDEIIIKGTMRDGRNFRMELAVDDR